MAPIPSNPKDSNLCLKCGQPGHMAVECPNVEQNINFNNKYFKCGSMTGHFARDCPNPENVKCHKCGKPGHLVRDCPLNGSNNDMYMSSLSCHKCEKGHLARECPNANVHQSSIQKQSQVQESNIQNESELKCYNCGQKGHTSKNCPKEIKMQCYICGQAGQKSFNCPSKKKGH